jgi:general secretion pathway protein E
MNLRDTDRMLTARERALALHYPFLDTTALLAATPDFTQLPLARALALGCLPVRIEGQAWVVIGDPTDADLVDRLATRTRAPLALADAGDLAARLQSLEREARALDGAGLAAGARGGVLAREGADGREVLRGEQISLRGIAEDESPVVRLVNSTLHDALLGGASDIHFEATPDGLVVRYRIDGVLDEVARVADAPLAEPVISRLKVLAELDIAERRVPQDGRFRVALGGRSTDLRVSIMPSLHGEDAVLRVLDKRQLVPGGGKLTLDRLGFDDEALARIRRLADEPYGMLLVTGPTGSGKTTTLYATIAETLTGTDKVVTIEDPVEYELAGVLQIPVHEKKGLDFARGLRSILRHDPDRIMVGEIRDPETAEIAVQAALTGHLVLSSVHANNVFDVFSRFAHMGVDPHALTAALNGIWAQRLLRKLCPTCAERWTPPRALLDRLGDVDEDRLSSAAWRRGRGCGDCRGSGYRGRRAIAEVLRMTDPLRQLVVDRAPLATLKAAARRDGTRPLREAALDLAFAGETSLEEVLRVTLSEA